ncbi:MAG TPA: ATP synthase F1 subunit gamma [Bdellovibrionota bacterium]|nr:ATP synthase F1 subunit gamma [Bdellovibrionota bacterium]
MANLRVIRKRIRTVASTRKITKAMKMVAAAQFRRFEDRVRQATPYAQKLDELLLDLRRSVRTAVHPLLEERPVQKRALVVFTSDRGLCGAFNANVLRQLEREMTENPATILVPAGRKGIGYVTRRNYPLLRSVNDLWGKYTFEKAAALADELVQGFVEKKYDRIDLLFSEFRSVISQRPKKMTLAPIAAQQSDGESVLPPIYEPNREEILKALVPRAIRIRFYVAGLNSLASEFGARMTAMDSATRNAGEMIDKLTLDMNRARQATITKELMEIIAGAEALK